MKEIKVDYTAEEIREYAKDKYTLVCSNHTSSGSEDELRTGTLTLMGRGVKASAYISTFVAHTKDNYLITTTVYERSYGSLCKSEYFGFNTSGCLPLSTVFTELPEDCQNELRATQWLAKNPAKLVDKFNQVLNASAETISSQSKDLARTEEMLVNAHHNMSKKTKAVFSGVWSRWDIIKEGKLPWFSDCLNKYLKGE